MFEPVIKWSGSKRSQAIQIASLIPEYSTYFEPFLGGGSVLYAVNPSKGVCGDICQPLIKLWLLIKNNPDILISNYKEQWETLQKEGYMTFYEVRDRFNKYQDPSDLFFLSRTCVNGLIRFNKKGEFNNSLHHTRKGINPDRIINIIYSWSSKIQHIDFVNGDYRDTTKNACEMDFIYLDPPYFNTVGRYYGKIDYKQFVEYLYNLMDRKIKFALSLDGSRGEKQYSFDIPEDLIFKKVILHSGNSSFKKVIDRESQPVYESLLLSWDPR